MSGQNRKVKNLLIAPGFQLRLSFYFIGSGLLVITVMIAAIFTRLMRVRELMQSGEVMSFETQTEINETMFDVVELSLFGFAMYVVLSFVFAIVVSHKIAGPVVAIRAYIEQLKQGNYDYGRRLRPRDELKPIMDELHELTDILRGNRQNESDE